MFPFDFGWASGLNASSCEATLCLLNIGRESPKTRIHTHVGKRAKILDRLNGRCGIVSLCSIFSCTFRISHCTPFPCVALHLKILFELWPLGHSYQAEWILCTCKYGKVKYTNYQNTIWIVTPRSLVLYLGGQPSMLQGTWCMSNIVHILWSG